MNAFLTENVLQKAHFLFHRHSISLQNIHPCFQVVYLVATYLDPAHKVFLTSAELVLVKEYLRRFVLPGLAGFSVPAISPSLLTTVDEVEKDIQLYEHKATLHMLHV